nr:hypothetical protein [Shewanella shenzhenensis]
MVRTGDTRLRSLICGASILGLSVGVAGPALAQSAASRSSAEVEEIVVTGFRQSLQTALNVKRDSVTSVD